MKRILLFVISCISIAASAQDLTGVWRGNFRSTAKARLMDIPEADDRYKFEVQVDQQGKKFTGVTYSYKTTIFYGKATCYGTISPTTKGVFLEELKIVEQRISMGSDICLMTLFLKYTKVGDEEFLEGTYTSVKTADTTDCGKGTVFLRKVVTSDFYKEPFLVEREKKTQQKKTTPPPKDSVVAKKTPVTTKPPATQKPPVTNTVKTPTVKKPVPPPAKPSTNTVKKTTVTKPPVAKTGPKPIPVAIDTPKKVERPVVVAVPAKPVNVPKILLTRENELVKTIITNATEINIRIYDNGSVDNDTISVYLDKKLVLSKQRLTEKAITLKIKLGDDDAQHELVMVAENLGEIPPNTSLMVVDAGKRQHEVRITSTEQKNAVIIFKYDKDYR